MQEILNEFVNLLGVRLGNIYTTEDSVRYTLFTALLKRGFQPHDLVLEYPHPTIQGAEVDTYIPSKEKRNGFVFEFKYDRQIPSGKNSPKSQKAGKVFNDLYRLAEFNKDSNAVRLFVYLTDEEMSKYFLNEQNGLTDFFNLPLGRTLIINENYISQKSPTFQKAIGGSMEAKVTCIQRETLPDKHYLRVYEIKPIS